MIQTLYILKYMWLPRSAYMNNKIIKLQRFGSWILLPSSRKEEGGED
jgi:hypothetical protein